MRLKSFDNYLIAIMGLFALISLYMLYGAKFNTQYSDNQLKVASIVEQIKTVKRKRDFYQSWVDVNPGDGLSQNDEIYTHGQSSAKIHFVNGPEISLFENSLLRIKTLNKENTLSLDKGNLTATLSKDSPKLDIVLNGKKYSFESERANIQIEQGATENKFLLLDGKAKLNINEASQEIKENQVLIQNKKTGDVKIKELPFILKTPSHNSVNYFGHDITIPFSWSYTSLSTPAKIIIAKNSTFKDIVHEETLRENHYSHYFNKAGIYYWKLVSSEELEGPIGTLTLIEERPLTLSLDKEIVYIGPKKSEKVVMSWPKDNAKKFLLKVAFPNEKTEEIELANNSYELAADQVGVYKISVKVQESNRPSALWSETASVEVVKAKAIIISSNTPELIEKVNYNLQSSSHLLSWNAPSSGVNYTIKLTKNNKTEIFQSENLSFPLSLKDIGEYEWIVTGETESGIVSNFITGKIIIKAPLNLTQSPSEGAVIELEKPDQLVSFKWDHVQNIKKYQFELASDPAFKNLIYEKDLNSNNISTALAKTGRYFWRVKIKKENSVEYSSPVSVEIKPTPPLARPEDLPSLKIKIKFLEDKTSLQNFNLLDLFFSKALAADPVAIAEWDLPANSRAKEYIIEIYQDQELTKLVTRIESSIPHIIWKNATLGIFYWRVSYVDFWGRKTEYSKASTLSTELTPEALKAEADKIAAAVPIELITPKHRENILDEAEAEYLFTWTNLPNTKSYQFIVARDLDFEAPLIHSKTNTNEIKIRCKDLDHKEGEYFWKVMTIAGNTSKRRMFHINCTPKKIEAPIVEVPVIKPLFENLKFKTEANVEEKKTHYIKLGLFPHELSYTNTSPHYSAKVSGNALNSVYALYHRPVEWKYFQAFSPGLWISRGKVFKTITFTDFELNLKAARNQTNFSWGPVVAMVKKTLYVESNLAITAEGFSSPLLGAFIQKEIGKISMNAEVKFGAILDYHVDLQYALKNRISVGAFVDGTSVSKDASKHSFSRMGLNLNYIFPFLDIEK
ncbi:MAG: hypothetical protein PHY93_16785 [Bacteriovorax sp.]|nr:hypothetical protein [Bacteriovorax sp.]